MSEMYEFSSRKETFPNHRVWETEFCGKPFVVETGKMGGLSNGSCLVRYGETSVMCNVTMSEKPRDGIDFFPLSVDFEEKLYAIGRIPGSFMRREGRPGEKAVLSSRVVDRPMRPRFPANMRNDVSVVMTVMSVDQDCSPEIAGMVGASLALSISDIPWNGPLGGVNVGLVDGELVLNPSEKQRDESLLALTVAADMDKIVMIEAGASEVDEKTMLDAIKLAHAEIKKIIGFINGIVAEIGKKKVEFQPVVLDEGLMAEVKADFLDAFKAAMDTDDKTVRDARLAPIREQLTERYAETWGSGTIETLMYKMQKLVVRRWLLDENKRVDGRGLLDVRPLGSEVGVLPRTHGSGLFTRGQTQVLTVATLGTISDIQKLDNIFDEDNKRYMHHYNFPPYSVGESRPSRGPGRREIGHGALAERALESVIPDETEFPYCIRLVSEVLSSNGSTSQGAVCGSTLALMDAGVPIKAPVAGISSGLITEGDRWLTFVDIQGVEDFYGDMDFKVAGTKAGITAIQMDLKTDGLTPEIIRSALTITRDARYQILDEIMLPCIAAPREELSPYAPKMIQTTIDPEKIREVIGKGGSVIQKITADTGTKIDIEDDGRIFISAPNRDDCLKALKIIEAIVLDPKVGDLFFGKVTRLMTFGAFVEYAPGKEGLIHISKLAPQRVAKVEDVVNIGDMTWVKIVEIDDKGRINLSRKDAYAELEKKEKEKES